MTEVNADQQQKTSRRLADSARTTALPPHVEQAIERMHSRDADGIAARLRYVRGDRSHRQFARELGVFMQNVNRYENGTVPHPHFLVTLALLEGVDIHWLLMGEADPLKSEPYRRGSGRRVNGPPPTPKRVDIEQFMPRGAKP